MVIWYKTGIGIRLIDGCLLLLEYAMDYLISTSAPASSKRLLRFASCLPLATPLFNVEGASSTNALDSSSNHFKLSQFFNQLNSLQSFVSTTCFQDHHHQRCFLFCSLTTGSSLLQPAAAAAGSIPHSSLRIVANSVNFFYCKVNKRFSLFLFQIQPF